MQKNMVSESGKMALGGDLLGIALILMFFLWIYSARTGKGIGDLIRDIRDGFK